MSQEIDIDIVRSIMSESGAPDREIRARDRARFIASAGSLAAPRPRRFGWLRRKVRIGGIGVPVVVLGVVATAAAATGTLVAVNATTVFQNNPQQQLMPPGPIPPAGQETVIPSSVRELVSATVPDYGKVEFWGAPTRQGGFCFATKLPDGAWGGYPASMHPRGGWVGGSVPGCTSTQQRQVTAEPAVRAGEQPSSGDAIGPTPVEQWRQRVRSTDGKLWNLSFGYVEVQGAAVTVRDPDNGVTAEVSPDGYYLVVEPTDGGDGGDLQVLDADGKTLQPDYTYGRVLPGYTAGAS